MTEPRIFPGVEKRVETGVVQFGDDWPGVFIRGDNAMGFHVYLRSLLDGNDRDLYRVALERLDELLRSCVVELQGEGISEPGLSKPCLSKTGLLPCPFCGQTKLSLMNVKHPDDDQRIYFIQCDSCGATAAPCSSSESAARVSWQMRSKEA